MTVRGQDFVLFKGNAKDIEFDCSALGGGMTGGSGMNWLMQRAQNDATDQVYKTGTIESDTIGKIVLTATDTNTLIVGDSDGASSSFWHRAKYTNSAGRPITLTEGTVTLEEDWSQVNPFLVETTTADSALTWFLEVIPVAPTIITV